MTISSDHLPCSTYSLDTPTHLLQCKHGLNQVIKEDTYEQYNQVTWITLLKGLGNKNPLYFEHILELRDILYSHTLVYMETSYAWP